LTETLSSVAFSSLLFLGLLQGFPDQQKSAEVLPAWQALYEPAPPGGQARKVPNSILLYHYYAIINTKYITKTRLYIGED
jgi:hypothetical protein